MEYVVSMALLLIIFAIAFEVFVPVAKSGKAESSNIQTQIEGLIGLELLRRDIVNAGVGLPWTYPTGFAYTEAATTEDPWKYYNDDGTGEVVTDNHGAITIAAQPPRPIIVTDGQGTTTPHVPSSNYVSGSDVLTIKSAGVADLFEVSSGPAVFANNAAVDKWTMLMNVSGTPTTRVWGASRDPATTDHVVVLQPANSRGSFMLALSGTNFDTNTVSLTSFQPSNDKDSYYVYALHDNQESSLHFPFNRADYYVSTDPTIVPKRCAPGTGVLVKRILDQAGQTEDDPLPLLDCVADFQVAIGVDNADNALSQRNCLTNPTGDHMVDVQIFFNSSSSTPTGSQIRSSYKEIRIYILAQEGTFERDYNFTHYTNYGSTAPVVGSMVVGEDDPNDCDPGGTASCNCAQDGTDDKLGRLYDLAANVTNYNHYRWRLFRLTIKPEGLATSTSAE